MLMSRGHLVLDGILALLYWNTYAIY